MGLGGGGELTWQQHTQIIKLSSEAYRHGESLSHVELNLLYLLLHSPGTPPAIWIALSKK